MAVPVYFTLVFCLFCMWTSGSTFSQSSAALRLTSPLPFTCTVKPAQTQLQQIGRSFPPPIHIHSYCISVKLPWWPLDRAKPLRWTYIWPFQIAGREPLMSHKLYLSDCYIHEIFSGDINKSKPRDFFFINSYLLLPGGQNSKMSYFVLFLHVLKNSIFNEIGKIISWPCE